MINPQHFKTERVRIRAQYMHPFVAKVMEEMVTWLIAQNINPAITETVSTLIEDSALKRVSATHRQGRAFDIRTKDWSQNLIQEFARFFNKKYGNLGAIGATTKQPTLLLHHDTGHGDHYHVQFNAKFAVAMPAKLEPQDVEVKKA